MASSLNVMTLNCWGIRIPFLGSKLVNERMTAIADLVLKSNLDVVVLQEVWHGNDYVTLSCKIMDQLPHTHYFYTGFMGGGVCIFSRYPIMETMYFTFPLNGHAHKLLHGDWYGSKGCGLAVLKVKDLTVNVYATHMHARYTHNDEFDEYATHRAAQGFSLSQFVKHTSQTCDGVILAGDFNSLANELAYRIIRCNAVVNDAWLEKNPEECGDGGYTCDTPDNCFTSASVKSALPHGQRIDYIFYRANDATDIRVESCEVLSDKVPDQTYDYSDHKPVIARMAIKKNITGQQVPELDISVRQHCVKDLIELMDKGFNKARYNKYFYFVTMLLSLMVLLLCRERYTGEAGSLHIVLEVLQGVMAVSAAISFWISRVLARCEQNVYLGQKQDLKNLLNAGSLSRTNIKRE